MLFFKLLLLAFIAHESMRIIILDEYTKLMEILKRIKVLDKDSEEYKYLAIYLYTNKHLLVLYITEVLYSVFAFVLLLTPFWLVGLVLILQSLGLSLVKKESRNSKWLITDSIISIIIMALGVILVS